jgi:hypothetical protein
MSRLGTTGLVLLASGGLLVGGCANATDGGLPYADPSDAGSTASTPTTLIASAPSVNFSALETDLIGFQAAWVCEFQRRTFADPSDVAAALDASLADAEISRAAYDEFLDQLDESQDLRSAVLFDYQGSCKP